VERSKIYYTILFCGKEKKKKNPKKEFPPLFHINKKKTNSTSADKKVRE